MSDTPDTQDLPAQHDQTTELTQVTVPISEAELRRIVAEEINTQFDAFKRVLADYVKRDELEGMIHDVGESSADRATKIVEGHVTALERDMLRRFDTVNQKITALGTTLRDAEQSVNNLATIIDRATDKLAGYDQRFADWGEFIKGRDDMVRANNRDIEELEKRQHTSDDMLNDVIVHRLQPMTMEVFGTETNPSLRSEFVNMRTEVSTSLQRMDAWRERQEQREQRELEEMKKRKERREQVIKILSSKPSIGVMTLFGGGLAVLLGATTIQELIDLFMTLFGG